MTIEEFDKVEWTEGMKCIFQDEEYGIAAVDFKERLIGTYEISISIYLENDADIVWKRCENTTLIK